MLVVDLVPSVVVQKLDYFSGTLLVVYMLIFQFIR